MQKYWDRPDVKKAGVTVASGNKNPIMLRGGIYSKSKRRTVLTVLLYL